MPEQKIKLITDSACDLPDELLEKYEIEMLGIPITIDGKGYTDHEDFDCFTFYTMLEAAKEFPSTSHIPAHTFAQRYKQAFDEGYTDVILVTITAKGSSMFDAANMAKNLLVDEYPETQNKLNICVIDSGTYTMAYGYPLTVAAQLIQAGKSADEVAAYLYDYFATVEIYFAPFSLEYAKKSGRISAAAGFVGDVLGLRPIISIIDGETKILEKVRGDKNVIPKLAETVKKNCMDFAAPYILLKGTLAEPVDQLNELLRPMFSSEEQPIYQIGPCIAMNSGPKVVGIILKGKRHR